MNEKQDKNTTRRNLLFTGIIISAIGSAALMLSNIFIQVWLAASHFSTDQWHDLASPESLPDNTVVPFQKHKVGLIKRKQKIAAISLECTHLSCLVTTTDQGFFCPCHGSIFGKNGEVYSGPATDSLLWHNLQIKKQRILVHSGRKRTKAKWISIS